MSEILKKAINPKLNRRSFLKWSAGVSGALAASGALQSVQQASAASGDGETLVPSGCGRSSCNNACVIKAAVKNYGTPGAAIVRIETDDQPDVKGTYQLRACVRGRSIRKHVYAPERIKYPMKRKNWSPGGGNRSLRGNDEWVRISWDEATTIIASEMTRIKAAYGNEGFHDFGQSGSTKTLHGRSWVQRLLNKFGGFTAPTGSYSFPGTSTAARYLWGEGLGSAHDYWDMLNSDYCLFWSFNPVAVQRQVLSEWHLNLVKEKFEAEKKRMVLVDSWFNRTGQVIASEWVPIKFQTDEAMMLAMLYVLFKEYGAHIDQPWIDARSVGIFPRKGAGTPEDPTVPADDCLKYYVLGLGADGKPAPAGHKNYPAKTPAWASTDTGVPAKTIIRITKEYADNSVFKGAGKKAAFYTGGGMNRRAYGENPYLLAAAIATITKNIGVSGGGPGFVQGDVSSLARGNTGAGAGTNPIAATNQFDVGNRALALSGEKVRRENDFVWRAYNIKMLWSASGNMINGNNNLNKTLKAIRDNIEFLVVSDPMWSVTAQFADLVLPVCTPQEHNDMSATAGHLIFINKCIEPFFESKTDMDACKMVADKLGLGTGFIPNTEDNMLSAVWAGTSSWSAPMTYAEFKAAGVAKYDRWAKPAVFLKNFIANPATGMPKPKVPSGKMEFYSMKIKQLIDTGKLNDKNGAPPKDTRPIPTYPTRIEGPGDPIMKKYPLANGQPGSFKGSHSTFRQLPWIKEIGPEEDGVIMHTDDAAERGIKTGDKVRVWNDRGEIWLTAYVTNTIVRGGTLALRGGWYKASQPGVIGCPADGGGPSVLTQAGRTSSLNVGTPSGSCAVQIAKLPDNFIVNPLRKEG